MNNKYLTPNVSDLYRAPRGDISSIVSLGIDKVSKINALIDYRNDTNSIGESQAIELLSMVRKIVSEQITLN